MSKFVLLPHERWGKELEIEGPTEFQLRLTVDYDDVQQEIVSDAVQKMLAVLNEHWNPEWKPVDIPDED